MTGKWREVQRIDSRYNSILDIEEQMANEMVHIQLVTWACLTHTRRIV